VDGPDNAKPPPWKLVKDTQEIYYPGAPQPETQEYES
jgi:hypothetical protein